MDYKDRNPILSQKDEFELILPGVCPFDLLRPYIHDYLASDGVTRFLSVSGSSGRAEDHVIHYLIEAPLNCKHRIAFELGHCTGSNYWCHKSWLIKLTTYLFDSSPFKAEYVTPSALDHWSHQILASFDTASPMDAKLKALEFIVETYKDSKELLYDYHKIYREFLPVYQRRMGKRVA